MLPSSREIAHREARRLAEVVRDLGGEAARVGGGWMASDVPGSWATFAAGVGSDGPVSGATLDALVAWYDARGRPAEVQATPYEHPSLFTGLAARGFVLAELTNQLARTLAVPAEGPEVAGLAFREVDPSDAGAVRAWVETQRLGFFPRGDAPSGLDPVNARLVRHPRVRLWLLELDGEVVGCGGLERDAEHAVLIAGCVVEGARRRGVQGAFVRHRLRVAAGWGCTVALVGSTPGGPTERNALRAGFRVVYTQVGLRRG